MVCGMQGGVVFRHRRATAGTEIGGVPIKAGDMILVVLIACNRDPEAFECPGKVDLERRLPRSHIAFSYGPRTCPGSNLARSELTAAIRRAIDRFPNMRLDQEAPPPAMHGFLMRSYRPLNVVVD